MNNIIATLKKELKSIFRDKKYLAIIFLTPLIVPLIVLFFGFFYNNIGYGNYKVATNYSFTEIENNILKDFGNIEFIQNKNMTELEKLYEDGEINAYLIKDNYNYKIYVDSSTESGMVVNEILHGYLNSYNRYLGGEYLNDIGVNPDEVFYVINVETNDLAKEGTDYFTNFLLNFALVYLILIITITAMNTTSDVIVGEKERGTFETLLTFPIKSSEIIIGKFLAIVVSCSISAFVGVSFLIPSFIIIKNNTPMFSEMNVNMSLSVIGLSLLILLLAACLSAGICILLTSRAKTFKEAQSKQSIINILALAPMFLNMLHLSNYVTYLIPLTNCGTILNDLFLNSFDIKNLLLVIGSSTIYIVLSIAFISKVYKREKSIF